MGKWPAGVSVYFPASSFSSCFFSFILLVSFPSITNNSSKGRKGMYRITVDFGEQISATIEGVSEVILFEAGGSMVLTREWVIERAKNIFQALFERYRGYTATFVIELNAELTITDVKEIVHHDPCELGLPVRL